MKTQFDTFENYLITVGVIVQEKKYTYTLTQLYYNIEFFRTCFNEQLSVVKALEKLHFNIKENELKSR